MIKFIIRLLSLFRPLFVRLGINFTQMCVIVSAKLTVNNRIEKNRKSKKDSNNAMLKQGILMGLSGPVIFYLSLQHGSLTNALLFFHILLFFLVFMNFITEYSQLLFNSNDNEILQRLPVDSKTTLAARIVSMLAHILFITTCLSIIPFSIILFWKGIGIALSFFIGVILNTIFSLLFANLFYIAALRYISSKKFEKFITYVQFIFIAIFVLGYQFATKISSQLTIDFSTEIPIWMYFTPPCYFMSITEVIFYPCYQTISLALLGVVSNLLLFVVSIGHFGSSFTSKISQIESAAAGDRPRKIKKIIHILSGIIARQPIERSGFRLTWRLTSDNMNFKQAVLPMIICTIIPNCIMIYHIFTRSSRPHDFSLPEFAPLYMLPLLVTVIIPILGMNDKINMLWIYQSKPLAKPGQFLLGCFKALYTKYFFPVFLFFFIFYFSYLGFKSLPDLLLIFSFSTLFSLVYYLIAGLHFPFSKEQSMPQSQFFKVFLVMLLLGTIAVLHFVLTLLPYATIVAIPVCWGIIYWVSRILSNISWKKIESQY